MAYGLFHTARPFTKILLVLFLMLASYLILFGAGVVLIGVEIFIIPGFGLFGVLGGVGVLAGVYLSLIGGIPRFGTVAGWWAAAPFWAFWLERGRTAY